MDMIEGSASLVLIFSDDVDYYLLMDHGLQTAGLTTQLASDVNEILPLAMQRRPGAVLLDCRSGGASASALCGSLKREVETRSIPVIAVINQGSEKDYVELVKSGIEEIFVRPVLPAKLIECVRSLLDSREDMQGQLKAKTRAVQYDDLVMNLSSHRVKRNGYEVHLSPIEFRLLRHLLENAETVVTRDELRGAAWQKNVHVGPRTVDVHVGRLRKALLSVSDKDLIRTVRSVGYALSRADV